MKPSGYAHLDQSAAEDQIGRRVTYRRRVIWLFCATTVVTITFLFLLRHPTSLTSYQPIGTEEDIQHEPDGPVAFDNDPPGWITFKPSTLAYKPRLTSGLAPKTAAERAFSNACADLWISQGQLCHDVRQGSLTRLTSFDALVTWENGSEPFLQKSRDFYSNQDQTGLKSGLKAIHFRTHGELRYSLRSLVRAFKKTPGAIRNLYLYTTDRKTESGQHQGLVPTWLNTTHMQHNTTRFVPLFPMDTFQSSAFETIPQAEAWRSSALPTFQSQSVESQLPNVHGISDTWLYSCDDFFMLKELTPSDIFTPLYGPVLRLQRNLLVSSIGKDQDLTSREGEWRSLSYANWLISQRFGETQRPYPMHIIKTYNSRILQEIESIWAEELAETATIRFRGRGTEVNMAFLFINFMIERHREALLWSFIVARSDANQDGQLDDAEMLHMVQFLAEGDRLSKPETQGDDEAEEKLFIRVPTPLRANLFEEALLGAQLDLPAHTVPQFTSADSYAYLSSQDTSPWGKGPWPDYTTPNDAEFCKLELSCFDVLQTSDLSAAALFTHVAFEDRVCGNCLVAALMHKSGTSGLEAFLPPPKSDPKEEQPETMSRVLPMTKSWRETDFNLKSILPRKDHNVRDFCVRLLLRYAYVIGDAPFRFANMRSLKQTLRDVQAIKTFDDASDSDPTMWALNDELNVGVDQVDAFLQDSFFPTRFPDKAEWEM